MGLLQRPFVPAEPSRLRLALRTVALSRNLIIKQPLHKSGFRSSEIQLDRLFLRPLPVRLIRLGLFQGRRRFSCLILLNISPSTDQYPRFCASTRSAKSCPLCSRLILRLPGSSLSGDAETGILFNVRLLCHQLSFHVSPLCALGR